MNAFERWVHEFVIVTSVLTLLFSTGIGLFLGYLRTLPPIEQLENYSPPQATALFDMTGERQIAAMARQNRVVVPLEKMPPLLTKAFISVEDKRFHTHFGIDFIRTAKAILVNIRRRRAAQGASTITQQLPRNLLRHISRKKVLSRKIRETLLALQMEQRYSKDQILEFYLNQIYLGNGAYGVQAAAKTFFNKDVSDLDLNECAILAGIPQRPARFSPLNNIEACTQRRNIVLGLMLRQGVITPEEFRNSIRIPIVANPPEPVVNMAPYFVEYVRRMLVESGRMDNESLLRDGYLIYTTLDLELQNIAQEELRNGLRTVEAERRRHLLETRLPAEQGALSNTPPAEGHRRFARIERIFTDVMNVKIGNYYGTIEITGSRPYYEAHEILKPGEWVEVVPTSVDRPSATFFAELADRNPLQGAVVILDAHTAEIRAMCGGENFYDMNNNGMWNRAAQGRGRQPGSAVKPLFYACAFDSGMTLATRFEDKRIVFPDGYSPRNFENIHFGWTTLQEAVEHSRNVVTIMMFQQLTARKAVPFVQRFDIMEDQPQWHLGMDPTVTLGSFSATPLSVAASYIPFVNGGIGLRPRPVTRIIDLDEQEVISVKPYEREIMSPESSTMVAYALQGVMMRGTGRKHIREPLEQALGNLPALGGKSGTTNNCVDAWFVGFTPGLVVCVWVGYDNNQPMGSAMTGSVAAGPVWREIVRRAIESGKAGEGPLPTYGNIVTADICGATGRPATDACRRVPDAVVYRAMPFRPGTIPEGSCSWHGF